MQPNKATSRNSIINSIINTIINSIILVVHIQKLVLTSLSSLSTLILIMYLLFLFTTWSLNCLTNCTSKRRWKSKFSSVFNSVSIKTLSLYKICIFRAFALKPLNKTIYRHLLALVIYIDYSIQTSVRIIN